MRKMILSLAVLAVTGGVVGQEVKQLEPRAIGGVREALELPLEKPKAQAAEPSPGAVRTIVLDRPEKTQGPSYWTGMPDGSAVWVGGFIRPDGRVHVGYTTFVHWDLDKAQLRRMASIISAPPRTWAFSRDGSRAVLCTMNPDKRGEARLHFVDVAAAKEVAPMWVSPVEITHVAIADSGTGACAWDGEQLRLFDFARGAEVLALGLPLRNNHVTALASTPSDLRVGLSDGRMLVIAAGAVAAEIKGHRGPVREIVGDALVVVTAGNDGSIVLWDKRQGQERMRLEAPPGGVEGLVISPDGKLLAGLGRDAAFVWRTFDGGRVLQMPLEDQLAQAVTFDAGSAKLRVLSADGAMREYAIHP